MNFCCHSEGLPETKSFFPMQFALSCLTLFKNKNKTVKLHCKQTHAVTQFSRGTLPRISQIHARWLCVLCPGTWQLIKPTGNNCVFSGSSNDFILPWLICTHHNSLWCDEYSTDKLPLSLSQRSTHTQTQSCITCSLSSVGLYWRITGGCR